MKLADGQRCDGACSEDGLCLFFRVDVYARVNFGSHFHITLVEAAWVGQGGR